MGRWKHAIVRRATDIRSPDHDISRWTAYRLLRWQRCPLPAQQPADGLKRYPQALSATLGSALPESLP
jgi:hypothetical protein